MTKLQGAFIGFGNIAELGHWPSYAASSEVEIVAVMDHSLKRLEIAKALKPALCLYSSVDELFRTEKIDFLDMCKPPSLYAELALRALAQNCHVLCEKPLTLKPTEYEELSTASAKSKRTVFTVHNWKYAPIFQKAFSILKEGKIGPVWHAEIFTLRNNVCQGTTGAMDPEDWRRNANLTRAWILVTHQPHP